MAAFDFGRKTIDESMFAEIFETEDDDSSSNSSCDGSSSSDESENDEPLPPRVDSLYIPDCADEYKPHHGKVFKSLEDGIKFYRNYAILCGFSTRMGTKNKRRGVVTFQYVYCFKEGHCKRKEPTRSNGKAIRKRRVSGRIGCKARISFSYLSNGAFRVSKFVEEHNHEFYQIQDLQFLRDNRNLTPSHKQWIIDSYRVAIGPVQAHKLLSQRVGGSHNVGATVVDFLNFERDLKVFMGETDGHFVLQTFHEKVSKNTGFFFEHDVDHEGRLSKLFWADRVAIENYKLYGDTIAFDTTYNTNRYGMVFCPFTGIDNHNKCVTLGFGLLGQEDAESFAWLFQSFMKCMDFKPPITIVTDQDPAMKKAIEDVLGNTRHRLCTWHIMEKLKKKVPLPALRDTTFFKQIYKLVWGNIMDIPKFENEWMKIIEEFKLEDNVWLTDIYNMRASWIAPFFKETPMGLLMRTTSRSEGENSIYGKRKEKKQQLVQFIWWCDTVVDDQRQNHTKLIMESKMCSPKWIREIPKPLEEHAWELYTRSVFYEVQKDIDDAIHCCRIKDVTGGDQTKVYKIIDSKVEYETCIDLLTNHCTCTCKRFEGCGLMCIHILNVLQTSSVIRIPCTLINQRWCREQVIVPNEASFLTSDGVELQQVKHKIWCKLQALMGNQNGTTSWFNGLLEMLDNFTMDNDSDESSAEQSKNSMLEEMTGLTMPETLMVKVPNISRTKGKKRMRSVTEKMQKKGRKKKRVCRNCHKKAWHDKRNCPVKHD